MHAGRRLPHRLIALLLLSGCTSPRYVGSIGRDGTYSNRGYGVAVRLSAGGLPERWDAIDPTEADRVPRSMRPAEETGPLDVDGDGLLQFTERTEHLTPTLRLLSRTSSVARIDVDVMILGGKNKTAPLDALMALQLKARAGTSTSAVGDAIANMKRRKVTPNFAARVAELERPTVFWRIALIDHDDFLAEEGIRRRQIVKVVLYAPRKSEAMIRDHERVLDALILNRRGSKETLREQW